MTVNFAELSPMSEFLVRNCMEPAAASIGGFDPESMKVNFFPRDEESLPADVLAKLNDCGDTERFAVTS